jgi:hypothetical protein
MIITDFRISKDLQVKVNNKWYNLITFTDDCPYGKFGIKLKCNKAFNPYTFFNAEESNKIEEYINK